MKKFMNKIRKNNKGFTLVELIIVIAIIAVLSAVLVPQYIQYVERSRVGVDESYISEVGHNLKIVASTDLKVYGKTIEVEIEPDGDIKASVVKDGATVDTAAQDIVDAELAGLFPAANQEFTSKYYKGEGTDVSTGVKITIDANGEATYAGCKNL